MPLTHSQIRHLRGLGHTLKPVVQIGHNGLTDAVLAELHRSLEHHELMKVKIHAEDREAKQALMSELCTALQCEQVQQIGHTLLIYRPAAETRLILPS